MIKNFKSKKLKQFNSGDTSKVAQAHKKKIEIILNALDTATSINDLDLPGLDLHTYAEYTPTRWSLKVSANYRIFFEWDGANVRNVDYDDPH